MRREVGRWAGGTLRLFHVVCQQSRIGLFKPEATTGFTRSLNFFEDECHCMYLTKTILLGFVG